MDFQIYNTLTKEKEPFVPLQEGAITLYVCGPTVYNYVHVGNARVSVFFDVVRRYFEYTGHEVTYIQNLTDVDDRIINAAKRSDWTELEIAEVFSKAYLDDLASLSCLPADAHPKVTEHIPEIIAFVEGLLANGMAYEVDGDVYFRVERFPTYGKLSNQRLADLRHTERDVAFVATEKENDFDFALWKSRKGMEIAWDSPWGMGRPGWHIECSAMSRHYLGDAFDIHGGGLDLCFPHHENEIAQSEGLTGQMPARLWMHNNYVTVDGQKMSKSVGNFTTVRDVLEDFEGEVLRLFYLSVNYRNPIDFSRDALLQAKSNMTRMKTTAFNLNHLLEHAEQGVNESVDGFISTTIETFKQLMQDDFNTADVVTLLLDFTKEINLLMEKNALHTDDAAQLLDAYQLVGNVLGLDFLVAEQPIDEEIQQLVNERDALKAQAKTETDKARKMELFAQSDAIRSQLEAIGIVLEDTAHGTRWKVANK